MIIRPYLLLLNRCFDADDSSNLGDDFSVIGHDASLFRHNYPTRGTILLKLGTIHSSSDESAPV